MPAKSTDTNVHKDHRQRLRARFLREGLENFQEHEVLELLLFYAIPQQNTNPIGHRLIEEFGSIADVFNADFNALMKVDGVKEYSATLLKLIPQLCSYYRASSMHYGKNMVEIDDIAKYCICKYMTVTNERLSVVMLDNDMHFLGMETLSEGGAESVQLDLELLASLLFARNCSSFVLVHNHPSGSLRPSAQDIMLTKKVDSYMREMNKHLVEHIILVNERYLPIMRIREYFSDRSPSTDDIDDV